MAFYMRLCFLNMTGYLHPRNINHMAPYTDLKMTAPIDMAVWMEKSHGVPTLNQELQAIIEF